MEQIIKIDEPLITKKEEKKCWNQLKSFIIDVCHGMVVAFVVCAIFLAIYKFAVWCKPKTKDDCDYQALTMLFKPTGLTTFEDFTSKLVIFKVYSSEQCEMLKSCLGKKILCVSPEQFRLYTLNARFNTESSYEY